MASQIDPVLARAMITSYGGMATVFSFIPVKQVTLFQGVNRFMYSMGVARCQPKLYFGVIIFGFEELIYVLKIYGSEEI